LESKPVQPQVKPVLLLSEDYLRLETGLSFRDSRKNETEIRIGK
jgi:hypothetical protein